MGDTPWEAACRESNHVDLTALMVEAARANCPTTAAFLQQAGAWCFFSGSNSSPLHAALEAKHWSLAKAFVRDLGGCIYIPDKYGRFPRDMMPIECREELEQVSYSLIFSLHLFLVLFVCVYVSVSVYLFCLCLCVCLPACLCLSACLYLSTCLSVSVRLSVCVNLCVSFCLPV